MGRSGSFFVAVEGDSDSSDESDSSEESDSSDESDSSESVFELYQSNLKYQERYLCCLQVAG